MHKIQTSKCWNSLIWTRAGALVRWLFERITTMLLQMSPVERILEFGSGPSSVHLAITFPEAQVLSVEGDWRNFAETTSLMRSFEVGRHVSIRFMTRSRLGVWLFWTISEGLMRNKLSKTGCPSIPVVLQWK
ncbi:MAG: hypothetical protein OXI24_18950 [Candidatus Poribacteria bacterium]|nr:hypothetical protein [Candidatus Poribacteria bacterium]